MTLGPILGHSTIETAYQEIWCAHVSILLGSGICASASAALNLRRTEDLGLSSNTGLYGRSGSNQNGRQQGESQRVWSGNGGTSEEPFLAPI